MSSSIRGWELQKANPVSSFIWAGLRATVTFIDTRSPKDAGRRLLPFFFAPLNLRYER